jgi:hypothetical protein
MDNERTCAPVSRLPSPLRLPSAVILRPYARSANGLPSPLRCFCLCGCRTLKVFKGAVFPSPQQQFHPDRRLNGCRRSLVFRWSAPGDGQRAGLRAGISVAVASAVAFRCHPETIRAKREWVRDLLLPLLLPRRRKAVAFLEVRASTVSFKPSSSNRPLTALGGSHCNHLHRVCPPLFRLLFRCV